jgi:hypothetical protein
MRSRFIVSLVLSLFVAAGALVRAVTNGQPDGNLHPFVGVAIQPIPTMPGFVFVCSGSALSARVFLTAAHCFDPSAPAFVSYKNGPPFGATFTPGTFHVHPDWCPECGHGLPGFDSHDVAVITLNADSNPGSFAALPPAGLVDTLPMGSEVDLVGYGVQGFVRGGGKPGQIFLFTRFFAPSMLIASNSTLSDEFIQLTANPAKGKGGLCFGDSGGPDLLGNTRTVLAVNSFVTNSNCAGVTYSQRVDLPDILAFISGFLH